MFSPTSLLTEKTLEDPAADFRAAVRVEQYRVSAQAIYIPSGLRWTYMALLFAIGIPFLLPHMHDRYFYAADILSLVMAFAFPIFSPVALLVQFASLLGYHAYLKMRYLLYMDRGSVALIVALILALSCFVQGVTALTKKKRR